MVDMRCHCKQPRRWANLLVQWTRVMHVPISYENAAMGAERCYSSAKILDPPTEDS